MADQTISVTLSNGRIAKVRRPKGRDNEAAERACGGDIAKNRIKFGHAVIASVTTIDDAPLVLEDITEMYADDIARLQEAVQPFLSPSTVAPSQSSSNGDSSSQS